jgi:dynein heavy chain
MQDLWLHFHEITLVIATGNFPSGSFEEESVPVSTDLSGLEVLLAVRVPDDLETPVVLWLAGLFNPMSFLTAIMQVTSRAHQLPLDDICLKTDVRNSYSKEDFKAAEIGAYGNGFFLEGAAWEVARGDDQGYLVEMQPKVLHPELPVMHVTAIRRADRVTTAMYECPVYVTSLRGPTYVFAASLQMESEDVPVSRWILAGVALLMSPE